MLFFNVRDTAGSTGQKGGPGLDSGRHALVSSINFVSPAQGAWGCSGIGLHARTGACPPAGSPQPALCHPLTGMSEAAGGAGRHLGQRLVSGCQALAG